MNREFFKRNYVLFALSIYGGTIISKTHIQKILYFLQNLNENVKLGYKAHFYGPYSEYVNDSIIELKNLGFIDEERLSFGIVNKNGFEIKRYDYKLNDNGRKLVDHLEKRYHEILPEIKENLRKIKETEEKYNTDYVDISIAAKAHWILEKKQGSMTTIDISKEANKFSWTIDNNQVEKACKILEELRLVGDA